MGVEIEITPAGKSTKRLTLLSGGEKSMTALAFLFAVFLARPCPFYILDEVEAALDDLNIDRFLTGPARVRRPRAVHRRHPPEAHDGGRRLPVRCVDGGQRRLEGHLAQAARAEEAAEDAGGVKAATPCDVTPQWSARPPSPRLGRPSSAPPGSSARRASSARAGVAGASAVTGSVAAWRVSTVRRRQRRRRALRRRRSAPRASSAASATSAAPAASACIGCVNCTGCVGCIGCSGLTGGVGRSASTVTIRRAIPNLVVDDLRRAASSSAASSASTSRWTRPGFTMFASPSNRTAQITLADLTTRGQDRGITEAHVSASRSRTSTPCTPRRVERGLEIVYPLTNEPWGIRRFFVKDPDGTVINVAQHV